MDDKLITEQEVVTQMPALDPGGYLELKCGEICLRRADSVEALRYSGWLVTREWLRPGNEPFDPAFYSTKPTT